MKPRNEPENQVEIHAKNPDEIVKSLGSISQLDDVLEELPEQRDKIIEALLLNEEVFIRIIKRGDHLRGLAEDFPEYADRIINVSINNSKLFQRLYKNEEDLIRAAQLAPNSAAKIIDHVLNSPGEFNRIFVTQEDWPAFFRTVEAFPSHSNLLMDKLLNDKDDFKSLIDSSNTLENISISFPERVDQIIHHILKNPELYTSIFVEFKDLAKITKCCPNHSDELIQHVLVNSDDYKRLIVLGDKTANECYLYNRLHSYFNIYDVIEQYPKYADKILGKLCNNPELFELVISNATILIELAEKSPSSSEKLVEFILQSRDRFIRILGNIYDPRNYHLKDQTIKKFPNYKSILSQPNAGDALTQIANLEIKKAARTLSSAKQGTKAEHSRVSTLPTEVLIKIASHSTHHAKQHSQSDAEKIAREEFKEPPKFKK